MRIISPGRKRCLALFPAIALCLQLAGCGGGSGAGAGAGTAAATAGATVSGPLNPPQAARFLNQATYGARLQDIATLQAQGIDAWITAQQALPATAQYPLMLASADKYSRNNRLTFWWNTAVSGPDQLRQRMALALSEIFVISDQSSGLGNNGDAIALYWDLLANDAFGNFRTLLQDVTLSPQMGLYLNMLGNQKPDPAHNIHADENYAREVMQLFTIGLWTLNPDGSQALDANGRPQPTYGQAEVSNLARALTGWSWLGTDFFYSPSDFVDPMTAFQAEHDRGAKTIVGGVSIPANGSAEADLQIALDTLFNHPNTPPFISRQLIQHLVTSNPSPAYVGRVAAVFANNGKGTRGDLGAVVRAILEDPEARSDAAAAAPGFGKRREPLVTLAHLWRVLDGHDANGSRQYWNPDYDLKQAPLSAPSVFNFFKPGFSPSGVVQKAGLVAPEFQLVTASNLALLHNFYYYAAIDRATANSYTQPTDILLHPGSDLLALATASDTGAMVDQLALAMMAGQMSAAMRTAVVTDVNAISAKDGGYARVGEAAFQILASPEYQIQR
ncbi:MAG: DUF1800 domain-containing protein [Pseudomonadota bacterium]|nr:DUF1800 domain-containing protein [Pseudomonadota bacterium]